MCFCPIAGLRMDGPFPSSPISSTFQSICTPWKTISNDGSFPVSCGCATRPFAILHLISKIRKLDDTTAEATARDIWTKINLRNLRENILPTMPARVSWLTKGPSHIIEEVELRKL